MVLPTVSAQSACWVGVAWCWGVVEQRRVSDVVPGLVLDWTGANTLVLEFLAQLCMAALWLIQPTPTAEALVRIPGKALLILSFRNGIGMWGRWGVGSQAFLMVTSACSCVDRERLGLGVGWYWCVLADCGG